MEVRLRILDRLVLEATWPALFGAVAFVSAAWFVGGPISGMSAGPYGVAVGLAVAYGRLARDGEYPALLYAGIAPRRIGAAVVVLAVGFALLEAALACAIIRPAVRTMDTGYVFAALQLPLMASIALPVAVRSRNEEPWARMVLLLIGYAIVTTTVRSFALTAGWAPGSEWLFIDVALLASDIALYRHAGKPRTRL